MKNAALIIIGAGLGAAATFGAFCGGFISGACLACYGQDVRKETEKATTIQEEPSEKTEE